MFEKFRRSWALVKASASVLRSDKELMLFPLVSSAATLLVLATFAVPTFALRIFENGFGPVGAIWAFAFYFCQYTVIIFFNSALVGAAFRPWPTASGRRGRGWARSSVMPRSPPPSACCSTR